MVANVAAGQPAATSVLATAALPAWARHHNQPVTYPRLFVEVARDRNIPAESVLRQAGLRSDLLDDAAGRVSLVETLLVLEAALSLTGDAAFGFETGYRLPLTAHGSLGYALMCASTPREAIRILERFWHLRGRGILMSVQETSDGMFLEVVPEVPLPGTLQEPWLSSVLTSMYRGIRFVMPDMPAMTEIWLQGDEPEGFAAWRDRLPCVRFGMPRCGIYQRGDKSLLDSPLPTANPEGFAQAISQCERESALLGGGVDPVLQRTRAILQLGTNGYPEPARIAGMLHMTPRTFRRRLQKQGSGYLQLLEEARRRDSYHLLEKPELEIKRISELLGYADPANFTRAFRQWTGMTPREWRASKAREL